MHVTIGIEKWTWFLEDIYLLIQEVYSAMKFRNAFIK